MEGIVSSAELPVLIFILAAFGVFSVTLGWASRRWGRYPGKPNRSHHKAAFPSRSRSSVVLQPSAEIRGEDICRQAALVSGSANHRPRSRSARMWSSAKGSYMRRAAGRSAGRLDQRPIPAPTNRLNIRRWVGPIRRRSRQNWFRFIDGPERAHRPVSSTNRQAASTFRPTAPFGKG